MQCRRWMTLRFRECHQQTFRLPAGESILVCIQFCTRCCLLCFFPPCVSLSPAAPLHRIFCPARFAFCPLPCPANPAATGWGNIVCIICTVRTVSRVSRMSRCPVCPVCDCICDFLVVAVAVPRTPVLSLYPLYLMHVVN